MNAIWGVVVAAALGVTEVAAPVDPASRWVLAAQAFGRADYEEARAAYEALAESHGGNGHVWYNLGNARLRSGDVGGAVAALRTAARLLPRDGDVRANLGYARGVAKDAIVPPAPSSLARTFAFWHHALSPREVVVGLLLTNLLLWLLVVVGAMRPAGDTLRWAVVLLAPVVVALAGSAAWSALVPERVAVVRSHEAAVHATTSRDGVVRFRVHAGTELRWSERRDGFVRVSLPDGTQGWLAEDDGLALEL